MSLSTKIIGGIGAIGIATGLAVLAPGAAQAAPTTCLSPAGAPAATSVDGLSQCDSASDLTSAAAGYGYEGWGSAGADFDALALGLGLTGGTAISTASNGAAPAAISYGVDSTAIATSSIPGLSIAIAGPGATITIDSATGAVCDGPGFAGNLVTGQSCLRLN